MESNTEKNLIISEDALFVQIKQLLDDARSHIARTVNTTIVNTYWQIGQCIVEHEQKGSQRAEYGRGVITSLSKRLSDEYGNGFSATNLKTMRQFYLCFPKGHALRDKISHERHHSFGWCEGAMPSRYACVYSLIALLVAVAAML